MVKIVNFLLCVFYHNKKLNNTNSITSISPVLQCLPRRTLGRKPKLLLLEDKTSETWPQPCPFPLLLLSPPPPAPPQRLLFVPWMFQACPYLAFAVLHLLFPLPVKFFTGLASGYSNFSLNVTSSERPSLTTLYKVAPPLPLSSPSPYFNCTEHISLPDIFLFLIYFLLRYSWFTILFKFQVYNIVIHNF